MRRFMNSRRLSIAQRLYDWTNKYQIWGSWPIEWKGGIVGRFAKRLHEWLWDNCDIIPF